MCPVLENHFCNSGAFVETIKNGNPTETAMSIKSHETGSLSVGGLQLFGIPIGKNKSGTYIAR